MAKLYIYEVTYETKDILGSLSHTRKLFAESAEDAIRSVKFQVQHTDGKRAYKCKAKRVKEQ